MINHFTYHLPSPLRSAQGGTLVWFFPSIDPWKNMRLEATCTSVTSSRRQVCMSSFTHPGPRRGGLLSDSNSCLSRIIFQGSFREIPNFRKYGNYCSMIPPCISQGKSSPWFLNGVWFNPEWTLRRKSEIWLPWKENWIPFSYRSRIWMKKLKRVLDVLGSIVMQGKDHEPESPIVTGVTWALSPSSIQ